MKIVLDFFSETDPEEMAQELRRVASLISDGFTRGQLVYTSGEVGDGSGRGWWLIADRGERGVVPSPDITDRHPRNLDWQLVSMRGCDRCNAGAGEPHTFLCADMRIAEAREEARGGTTK